MNRRERFVDSGFWLALVNRGDELHERARRLNEWVRPPLVTTEAVLVELGNTLSRLRWRALAVRLLEEIRTSPDSEIIPVTTELLQRAIARFASRMDKEWGLTDSISFVVMEERGIEEALAYDQHFVQAGFRALLREP